MLTGPSRRASSTRSQLKAVNRTRGTPTTSRAQSLSGLQHHAGYSATGGFPDITSTPPPSSSAGSAGFNGMPVTSGRGASATVTATVGASAQTDLDFLSGLNVVAEDQPVVADGMNPFEMDLGGGGGAGTGAEKSPGSDGLMDLFGDFASPPADAGPKPKPRQKKAQSQAYTSAPFEFGDFAGFDDEFFGSGSGSGGATGGVGPTASTGSNAVPSARPALSSYNSAPVRPQEPVKIKKVSPMAAVAESKEETKEGSPRPGYPPPRPPRKMSDSPAKKAPKPPRKNAPELKNGTSSSKSKRSIDVLPLMHKGVKMNKFKLRGNKSKVRLFFLSKDNKYFHWSPHLDQASSSGFDFSNLIKSEEERAILLEGIKEIRRNPPNVVTNLRFIPKDKKKLTFTITYNANAEPRGGEKQSRGRSKTFAAGMKFKPPVYKQINVMAYEQFHYEMVLGALERLWTAAKDPSRDVTDTFELYIDFEKEVLPKHLRPAKFKWEALKEEEMEDAMGVESPKGRMQVEFPDDRDRIKSF